MFVFVIKKIRQDKNISLYELSKRTDISRTYLRLIENNKKTNPSVRILEDIANALNVDVKDLFYSTIELEKLRKEMYCRIDKFGLNSEEVLEVSQIIDLLVNIKMNKN